MPLEIPGVRVVERNTLQFLRSRVNSICHLGKAFENFPGAQPISFTRKNIDDLKSLDFFIGEKADGIRCLLLTICDKDKPETYLIDRKNDYYYLDFGFPTIIWKQWRTDTILDGELVLDIDPDSGKSEQWFLIFDCVAIDGLLLSKKSYDVRLGFLSDYVMKPFSMHLEKNQSTKQIPFKVTLKKLERAYNIENLFNMMNSLKHNSDGIIFTSKNMPYIFGSCSGMLKWKPHHENTVDFQLRTINDKYMLYIRSMKGYECVGTLILEPELEKSWKENPPKDGTIVECSFITGSENEWRFNRFRTDKLECNYITTYENIMVSINEYIDKQALIENQDVIRQLWKDRESKTKRKLNFEVSEETVEFDKKTLKCYQEFSSNTQTTFMSNIMHTTTVFSECFHMPGKLR